jgi:hypothetical protein
MVDRHFLGDVALAVILAIPVAALTRPDPVTAMQRDAVSNAQAQHRADVREHDRPVSLLR